MATMNIIQAMNRLRSDIQTWVANNLRVKVNAELKTDSTEEYKVLSDNNFTDADKNRLDSAITEHQDISGKQDKLIGIGTGQNIKTINGQNLLGSGNIVITSEAGGITSESDPIFSASAAATITSTNITTWTNKYSKPTGGIPKTDLASAVQTSLGKADTALQSEQYKGTVTGINMNGSSKGTSGVVDLGTVITGSDIYVLSCTGEQFASGWTSNATEYNAISNAKIVLLDRDSDLFCSTNIYKGEDRIILDFYNITSDSDKGFTLTIHKSGYAVTRTRKYNIYPTALSWINGNTSGPTGTITLHGASEIAFPQIPSASSTTSGVITTAEQTFAGNKTFSGIVTGTQGFFDTSDARLKNFGEDLKVDFDILCKIPKKYFTWKDDYNNKLQIGTSAQEIQKIYPELVNDENGVLSVAYDKLSIIALSAIDELYKKNQELEMRLCKIEEMLKYGE